MNTQIIAIANQKGGVGKTTTCANLGIGLAQAGKKVLLIDGDPQGSLTISLGNPQPDKLPFTLSDAMGKILMDHPIRPGEGILHHAEGVDLMPADIQLSGMEVSLVNAMSRETVLRQYLDTLKGQYSHIVRRDTLRNSGRNMRKKFCSTRLLRMPLMRWESRSCPRSKSCRRSTRNCWKKRKRPMPSTGVPVRKCGSF